MKSLYRSEELVLERAEKVLASEPENIIENQYFLENIIKLSGHENFVDIGAFDGDTIEQFLKVTNNSFNHIYGFEMDAKTYNRLQEKVLYLNKLVNNYQIILSFL